MTRLFFAGAAVVLRFFSWVPFGWIAMQIRDAAKWCEDRS